MGFFSQTGKNNCFLYMKLKTMKGTTCLWTLVSNYNSCYIHDIHAHTFAFSISLIKPSSAKVALELQVWSQLIKPVHWSPSDCSP